MAKDPALFPSPLVGEDEFRHETRVSEKLGEGEKAYACYIHPHPVF